MIEIVLQYYANERQFALVGVGIGVVLVILAAILWRTSEVASLGAGMAYFLMIAGMLQATASFSYMRLVNRRAELVAKTYVGQSEAEIKRQELVRMHRVLKSGYTGALVTYSAFLLIGAALVFIAGDVPIWKGVALALMIVGVIGHCIEAFSMQENRQYLHEVDSRPVPVEMPHLTEKEEWNQ